jgi:hypothetical protein
MYMYVLGGLQTWLQQPMQQPRRHMLQEPLDLVSIPNEIIPLLTHAYPIKVLEVLLLGRQGDHDVLSDSFPNSTTTCTRFATTATSTRLAHCKHARPSGTHFDMLTRRFVQML